MDTCDPNGLTLVAVTSVLSCCRLQLVLGWGYRRCLKRERMQVLGGVLAGEETPGVPAPSLLLDSLSAAPN